MGICFVLLYIYFILLHAKDLRGVAQIQQSEQRRTNRQTDRQTNKQTNKQTSSSSNCSQNNCCCCCSYSCRGFLGMNCWSRPSCSFVYLFVCLSILFVCCLNTFIYLIKRYKTLNPSSCAFLLQLQAAGAGESFVKAEEYNILLK